MQTLQPAWRPPFHPVRSGVADSTVLPHTSALVRSMVTVTHGHHWSKGAGSEEASHQTK